MRLVVGNRLVEQFVLVAIFVAANAFKLGELRSGFGEVVAANVGHAQVAIGTAMNGFESDSDSASAPIREVGFTVISVDLTRVGVRNGELGT